MTKIMSMVAVLALAGTAMIGCGTQTEQAAAPASGAQKSGKTTYICHMGADCGKSDVAAGEKIPSCCGKVMVKADSFTCGSCGKSKICEAGKAAPECCGAAMKKVAQP